MICMYDTYMPNKTISVPEDVVPIITAAESLAALERMERSAPW